MDRLADDDRRTLLAAAVLGQQFEGILVDHVIGAEATASLARLVDAEFIQHLGGGEAAWSVFEFHHALVRQAAYGSLLKKERQSLHLRAAQALEESNVGRTNDISATIGRHHAEGGDAARAVPYLLQATRSAARTFSSDETVRLATEALQLLGETTDTTSEHRQQTIDLLRLAGTAQGQLARYDSAIATYRQLVSVLPDSEHLDRARTVAQIGKLLSLAHAYEDAFAELEVAESLCPAPPWDDDAVGVWLEIQLTRAEILYWLDDYERLKSELNRIEPVVKQRATSDLKLEFLGIVRQALWRRDRYIISDETLEIDREIFLAETNHEDEEIRAWASFYHGFTLMWHRDLDEADRLLDEGLAASARIGSTLLRARCLNYKMVVARFRGDPDAAWALLEPVRDSARDVGLLEYEAMAAATAAWIAYRSDDHDTVLSQGLSAMAIWSGLPSRYVFDWMCCLPLLAVAISRDDQMDAEQWTRTLLAPGQQPLPGPIAEELKAGLGALDDGAAPAAWMHLRAALAAARELSYL
ncbi:MAG: hypothetical protein WCP95_17960 [Actinomycetes bacterium]